MLFITGSLYITANAKSVLDPCDVVASIGRHVSGDWGELCDEDKKSNEQALKDGTRIFSVYRDHHGTKFWIITEADRSATTVLLPEDY